ncbi:hypothetical protein [Phenylobacterium sp.]|uniref:hypothetical protein n=1 Tax=Phenylobacterium sp. TaxID=1871053 RepID=UPI0012180B8A|nr:hypothetical protein [Phenylobacterium sp.]THD59405.1 MAG: hypothetical protein E8A49_16450 [Phenylobacterium sp.]
MTQTRSYKALTPALAAILLAVTAGAALADPPSPAAKDAYDTNRAPGQDSALTVKPPVTSDLSATRGPTVTPAEQRSTRTLASAIFAKPGAAQKAADKAASANDPVIPPGEPKSEWLPDQSVKVGGKGLQVTAPF